MRDDTEKRRKRKRRAGWEIIEGDGRKGKRMRREGNGREMDVKQEEQM